MIVEFFPVGMLWCNCVVLGDPLTRQAIVVDPGDEVDKILAALGQHGLACRIILNTHTHIDHVGANFALKQRTEAKLMLHAADLPLYHGLRFQAEWMQGLLEVPAEAEVDQTIGHGDRVSLGSIVAEVIHTPGHSPGSLCFYLAEGPGLLLSGDTLMAGGIGRTDLWGGDYEQEMASIHHRVLKIEDPTRVIPGHGPETTIGAERRSNPFLVGL